MSIPPISSQKAPYAPCAFIKVSASLIGCTEKILGKSVDSLSYINKIQSIHRVCKYSTKAGLYTTGGLLYVASFVPYLIRFFTKHKAWSTGTTKTALLYNQVCQDALTSQASAVKTGAKIGKAVSTATTTTASLIGLGLTATGTLMAATGIGVVPGAALITTGTMLTAGAGYASMYTNPAIDVAQDYHDKKITSERSIIEKITYVTTFLGHFLQAGMELTDPIWSFAENSLASLGKKATSTADTLDFEYILQKMAQSKESMGAYKWRLLNAEINYRPVLQEIDQESFEQFCKEDMHEKLSKILLSPGFPLTVKEKKEFDKAISEFIKDKDAALKDPKTKELLIMLCTICLYIEKNTTVGEESWCSDLEFEKYLQMDQEGLNKQFFFLESWISDTSRAKKFKEILLKARQKISIDENETKMLKETIYYIEKSIPCAMLISPSDLVKENPIRLKKIIGFFLEYSYLTEAERKQLIAMNLKFDDKKQPNFDENDWKLLATRLNSSGTDIWEHIGNLTKAEFNCMHNTDQIVFVQRLQEQVVPEISTFLQNLQKSISGSPEDDGLIEQKRIAFEKEWGALNMPPSGSTADAIDKWLQTKKNISNLLKFVNSWMTSAQKSTLGSFMIEHEISIQITEEDLQHLIEELKIQLLDPACENRKEKAAACSEYLETLSLLKRTVAQQKIISQLPERQEKIVDSAEVLKKPEEIAKKIEERISSSIVSEGKTYSSLHFLSKIGSVFQVIPAKIIQWSGQKMSTRWFKFFFQVTSKLSGTFLVMFKNEISKALHSYALSETKSTTDSWTKTIAQGYVATDKFAAKLPATSIFYAAKILSKTAHTFDELLGWFDKILVDPALAAARAAPILEATKKEISKEKELKEQKETIQLHIVSEEGEIKKLEQKQQEISKEIQQIHPETSLLSESDKKDANQLHSANAQGILSLLSYVHPAVSTFAETKILPYFEQPVYQIKSTKEKELLEAKDEKEKELLEAKEALKESALSLQKINQSLLTIAAQKATVERTERSINDLTFFQRVFVPYAKSYDRNLRPLIRTTTQTLLTGLDVLKPVLWANEQIEGTIIEASYAAQAKLVEMTTTINTYLDSLKDHENAEFSSAVVSAVVSVVQLMLSTYSIVSGGNSVILGTLLTMLGNTLIRYGDDIANNLGPAFVNLGNTVEQFSLAKYFPFAQWSQMGINHFLGKKGIDQKRIEGFETLPYHLKTHLFWIIRTSSSISEAQREILDAGAPDYFKNKAANKISTKEDIEFEKTLLTLYDSIPSSDMIKLTPALYSTIPPAIKLRIHKIVGKKAQKSREVRIENFVLTPSYFLQMPLEIQKKIAEKAKALPTDDPITIVKKWVALPLKERCETELIDDLWIVDAFNALPFEEREKISNPTFEEFSQLKRTSQEDLLFRILHSQKYKEHEMKKKLSFSPLKEFLLLQKGIQEGRLQKKDIEHILKHQNLMTFSETYGLSPQILQQSLPYQQKRVLEIVENLHPEQLKRIKEKLKLTTDEQLRNIFDQKEASAALIKKRNELLTELCSELWSVNPIDQALYMDISETALENTSPADIKKLIMFMLKDTSKTDKQTKEKLQASLVYVEKGPDIIDQSILKELVFIFNSLPKEEKAEWLQKSTQENIQNNDLFKKLQGHLEELSETADSLQQSIQKLRKQIEHDESLLVLLEKKPPKDQNPDDIATLKRHIGKTRNELYPIEQKLKQVAEEDCRIRQIFVQEKQPLNVPPIKGIQSDTEILAEETIAIFFRRTVDLLLFKAENLADLTQNYVQARNTITDITAKATSLLNSKDAPTAKVYLDHLKKYETYLAQMHAVKKAELEGQNPISVLPPDYQEIIQRKITLIAASPTPEGRKEIFETIEKDLVVLCQDNPGLLASSLYCLKKNTPPIIEQQLPTAAPQESTKTKASETSIKVPPEPVKTHSAPVETTTQPTPPPTESIPQKITTTAIAALNRLEEDIEKAYDIKKDRLKKGYYVVFSENMFNVQKLSFFQRMARFLFGKYSSTHSKTIATELRRTFPNIENIQHRKVKQIFKKTENVQISQKKKQRPEIN